MTTVFVAEIVPSQNKGEAALMHGIVRSIQEFSDDPVTFYLCSESREEDQQEYGDNVKVIGNYGLVPVGGSSLSKLKKFMVNATKHILFLIFYKLLGKGALNFFKCDLWRAYFEADVILVGHDNAFSKFHIPLILYSKILGKKTAVYGCTIMPKVLNTSLLRKMGAYALNKADLITCREPLTFEHLRSIGVNKTPLYYTADKAFILDSINPSEATALMEKLNLKNLPRPLIGVMIVKGSTVFKAAFKDEAYEPAIKYDRHVEEIAKALDEVYAHSGGTFVFIPHCIGPGDDLDDRVCAVAVKKKMKHSEHVQLLEEELRVTELKGLLGQLNMVVSERTHGGINTATMLVPTLWITHPKDHRTYGIVSDTLELPQCLYNIEYLNSTELSSKILSIWESREEVVNVLRRTVPKAFDASMGNGRYFKQHILDVL